MTTPPSGSPPADEYSLNRIKGIGPTRQQQLQTLLAIATVLDLAAAEAEAIEAAFRDAGYPITRSNAAAWIAQARQLIEAETRQTVETRAQQAGRTIPPSPGAPSEEAAIAATDEAPAIAEEWQTQATVQLEFQTQGEGSAHRWRLLNPVSNASLVLTDQASDSLRAWLQQQLPPADDSSQQDQEDEASKEPEIPPLTTPPPTVKVRQVTLLQPPDTTMQLVALEGNTGFSGVLQANQPFQVWVCLALPELGHWALPSGVSYSLEGFAKTLAYPHHNIAIGKSQPCMLTSGQTQYKTAIAAAALPSGLYRLQILITFRGVDIPLGIHEISRLQVI